ncbi:CvpA family protein [Rickettsiales bacterium]|nr:CvpA family protein [Rickettsiales bacterium]MDB2550301.1 CvpA family protein [Rickettsiales bacterium]
MGNNQFDLAIIVIFLMVGLFSFLKGFAKDFCSTICWLCAIILSQLMGAEFAILLKPYIPNIYLAKVISHSILFIVILTISYLFIAKSLRPILQSVPDPINQSLGFGFGVIKAYAILSFLFAMSASIYNLNIFNNKSSEGRFGPSWLQESKSYAILEFGASKLDFVTNIMPETMNSNGKGVLSFYMDGDTSFYENQVKNMIEKKMDDQIAKDPNKEIIEPSNDSNSDEIGGYEKQERKKMDRLIQVVSIDNKIYNEENNSKDDIENENSYPNMRVGDDEDNIIIDRNIDGNIVSYETSMSELEDMTGGNFNVTNNGNVQVNWEDIDWGQLQLINPPEDASYMENLFNQLTILKTFRDNLFGGDVEVENDPLNFIIDNAEEVKNLESEIDSN